jgi:hypothetical protein
MHALPTSTENGFGLAYERSQGPQAKPPGIAVPQPPSWSGSAYPCGSSVSVSNSMTTGTMGCLLRDRGGRLQGLSANHVTGSCLMTPHGMPITAPGLIDISASGMDPFTIGRHTDARGWMAGLQEYVDVAQNRDASIFHILDPDRVTSRQGAAFDTPALVADPDELTSKMRVRKVGRSTGLTTGRIHAIADEVVIEIHKRGVPDQVPFTDLVAIQGSDGGPFAEQGDSGALVVGEGASGEVAIGIIVAVAADGSLTYVAALRPLLAEFGCELVSGHNL